MGGEESSLAVSSTTGGGDDVCGSVGTQHHPYESSDQVSTSEEGSRSERGDGLASLGDTPNNKAG
eukprot:CAMPEP_0113579914 /NCGR_PEP_ID=MMETSP0015_2-20120614/30350_1 /TAXON_ID=2838 /ORGANISM="Odontella" /LENGTH=64 /DNA_ID=CAMNT_0000483981 /DNA_START=39 /DNA_END=229 /DNA_ORIENTATION=- /assembly_acc=CAM_ASM_000160